MTEITLTEAQQKIVEIPLENSIFLEGEAGNGKTTCALSRFSSLLDKYPGHKILVMVPQRSLGLPYIKAVNQKENFSGSMPSILTLGGLTRKMVDLFWPMIAKDAGFLYPQKPPQFLSTETAQYCMGKVIAPLIDKGYFQQVVLANNRLYGQILDNLNKAAIIRFPLDEIAQRLKTVVNLEAELKNAYDQVVICAKSFRDFCLSHSLLDYSLQVEVFFNHFWKQDICKNYLLSKYKILFFDNVEEDVPIAHDIFKEWLPNLESALFIYDLNGGYRSFLGADPISAERLKPLCSVKERLDTKINNNLPLSNFSKALRLCILHEKNTLADFDFSESYQITDYHFYPEMIKGIAGQIEEMVNSKTASPDEIVILSPYLSDALNYSLSASLDQVKIPHRSSRPSQMYCDDPSIRAFLTFAKIAHPQWQMKITFFEMRNALMVVLPGLDIVKADLITNTLFNVKQSQEGLRSFDSITNPTMQERITFQIGEKLEIIRNWLINYKSQVPQPLDVFLSILFGELFSQKEFSFFTNFQAASRIAQIIQSIRSFRQFITQFMGEDDLTASIEYIISLESGLLPSAVYVNEEKQDSSILIAPAHTFLMENRQVNFQFWLDIGSLGWWERLNQPLTNPYLLNRTRDSEKYWTESLEYEANQTGMLKVVDGLINRCGKKIYINTIHTNEYGSEQKGPLLKAFNTLQKRIYLSKKETNV